MIKLENPPNIEAIKKVLPLHKGIIFTYGKDVYNPDGAEINSHVLYHEGIHSKQQGDNPKEWWKNYLPNDKFRAIQELEAYQMQYEYICKQVKDREARNHVARQLAKSLSGEMYGKVMGFDEAVQAIKA